MTARDVIERHLNQKAGLVLTSEANADAILAALDAAGYAVVPREPNEALEAEVAALRVTQERQNSDTMLLRQCYVTLAFAFYRLHESARSRDGELCLDFQRVRALIEKRFREIGIKL